MLPTGETSSLHADLLDLLEATRLVERDLVTGLPAEIRESPGADGSWSPKDLLAHLAAWRFVEARRLLAAVHGEAAGHDGDPAPDDPIDESNAGFQARYAEWSWDAVAREADASVDALRDAIDRSSAEMLCECDGTAAGIGSNGANHAVGHLSDIARMAGGLERYDAFSRETEAILQRGHLPPRDSGVILYNLACHAALTGQLDEARRLLRDAFARRPDLATSAPDDPDLAALRDELGPLGLVPNVERT